MQDETPTEVDYGEQTFDKTFGIRVRETRKERKWSQRMLAEELQKLGVKLDPSAVTRIERGAREVKLREAAAIAAVLAVPLQDLAPPPTASLHEQFLACLGSGGEQGLDARQALASMSLYYAQALHLASHDPGVIAETAKRIPGLNNKQVDDLRRHPATMTAAVIQAIAGKQAETPLAYAASQEQAEQLTAIVNATVANLVGVRDDSSAEA